MVPLALALLPLLTPSAFACDRVDLTAPGVSLSVDECGDDAPASPPVAAIVGSGNVVVIEDGDEDDEDEDGERERQSLTGQYGMQFLPDAPGHQLGLRLIGERDAWVGGELRYTPGSDFAGVGRVGAGVDLAGGGNFDLTVGLFVGAGGEWARTDTAVALYASPLLGTEVGLGLEGRRLFGRYRWLAGIGGGPMDELLTENEATVGYKVTRNLHLYGQYLVLSPGRLENHSGVGLGVRVAL